MTRHWLALADAACAERFVGAGRQVIYADGCALLCQDAVPATGKMSAIKIINEVRIYQQHLEDVQQYGRLLPVQFNTQLLDDVALMAALHQHRSEWRQALATYGLAREYEVQIRGRGLKQPAIWALLEGVGVERCRLPPRATDLLLHAIILMPDADPRLLDAALEAIDEQAQGGLQIRCVGPLPALHFACLRWQPPTVAKAQAARRLGIALDAPLAALRTHWRGLVRQLHPDSGDGNSHQFQQVMADYRLLQSASSGFSIARTSEEV